MSPNKVNALTFDSCYELWIIDMWIHNMDQFFEPHNLFDNRELELLRRYSFMKPTFNGEMLQIVER